MSVDLSFSGRCRDRDELLRRAKAAADAQEIAAVAAADDTFVLVRFCDKWDLGLSLAKAGLFGGLRVDGECRTSLGGPGLHAAVVDFADALGLSKLSFEDETGYAGDRDFGRLADTFAGQLRGYAQVMADNAGKPGLQLLAWPFGPGQFLPAEEPADAVATPMGLFGKTAWRDAIERDGAAALAGRVYLWPHRAFDATALRNLALLRLWMDCRYLPSSRDPGIHAENEDILALLETAHREDPALPLPLESYRELCSLHGREPAIPADAPAMDETPRPGYRRGLLEYKSAGLVLVLPGAARYLEGGENGRELWYEAGEGGAVWRLVAYRLADGGDATAKLDEEEDPFPATRERHDIQGGTAVWSRGMVEEEAGPTGFCLARIASGPRFYVLTVAFSGDGDWPRIRDLLLRLRCDPDRA